MGFNMNGATILKAGKSGRRGQAKKHNGDVSIKCGNYLEGKSTYIRFYGDVAKRWLNKRCTILYSEDKNQIGFLIEENGEYSLSRMSKSAKSIAIQMQIRRIEADVLFKNHDGYYNIEYDKVNDVFYIDLDKKLS